MVQFLYFISLFIGTILLLLGISNKNKKANSNEKTTTGTVTEFGLLYKEKSYPTKYRAKIKSGNKTYIIEQYSMPWLKAGEKVKLQITGKQKILGNDRLNNKSLIQLIFGILFLIIPFIIIYI